MSIEVLVFDVDDTLVYTFETAFLKTRAVARAMGVPPPSRQRFLADYGQRSFRECVEGWFPGTSAAYFDAVYSHQAWAISDRPVTRFADVQRRLSRRGIRVGVLTNGPRDRTLRKLKAAAVDLGRLDFLFCAEHLPRLKPDPIAFLPVLRTTGRDPARHAYVADSPGDQVAAHGAGLAFIGVRTGPHPCPRAACEFLIDSVEEVETCL